MNETTIVLGIPVDNVSMESAIARIFGFVEAYRQDGHPRLVTTINVDFTVKSQGWFGVPRHPELIQILRTADLATADGMPIVWYSRWLGCRLPGRVTGADMVPTLSRAAAERGVSVYLLGGDPTVSQRAGELLCEQSPTLQIAGIDSPFVNVAGDELSCSDVDDAPICDRINAAAPDILFVAFGNPKQELWFNRNRHRLQVPVTIGIGGSFNFLTGTVARAPGWMQRFGLEWVHRLCSEPRRLLFRYILGIVKFTWMSVPALTVGVCDRMRRAIAGRNDEWSVQRYYSGDRCVALCGGGRYVNENFLSAIQNELDELVEVDDGAVVVDMAQVLAVDGPALGGWLRLVQRAKAVQRPLLFLNVGRGLRRRLRWNRISDVIQGRAFATTDEIVSRLRERWSDATVFLAVEMRDERVVLRLLGRLCVDEVGDLDRGAFSQLGDGAECMVDLRYCTELDGSGIGLLMRLQKECSQHDTSCIITGANRSVRNLFKVSGVYDHFRWNTGTTAEKTVSTMSRNSKSSERDL